jgi:hypothetical protein
LSPAHLADLAQRRQRPSTAAIRSLTVGWRRHSPWPLALAWALLRGFNRNAAARPSAVGTAENGKPRSVMVFRGSLGYGQAPAAMTAIAAGGGGIAC